MNAWESAIPPWAGLRQLGVAAPPTDPIARIREALDPDARARGFERWKAEQFELQEARRLRGAVR